MPLCLKYTEIASAVLPRLQQFVAIVLTKRAIEGVEMIKVEKHQREALTGTFAGGAVFQPFFLPAYGDYFGQPRSFPRQAAIVINME
jgi:hypothetical protein